MNVIARWRDVDMARMRQDASRKASSVGSGVGTREVGCDGSGGCDGRTGPGSVWGVEEDIAWYHYCCQSLIRFRVFGPESCVILSSENLSPLHHSTCPPQRLRCLPNASMWQLRTCLAERVFWETGTC